MMNDEERLKFFCPTLLAADGVTKLKLLGTGRLSMEYSDADIESAMSIYVNAIELANVSSLDVALVDGRFRLQCALKLLPYMEGNGTVLIHDFWVRAPYHGVLKYYDVIGYARSVVALRKKTGLSKEEERGVYKKYMTREHGMCFNPPSLSCSLNQKYVTINFFHTNFLSTRFSFNLFCCATSIMG